MENNFNLEILKVMYRAADELINSGSIILPAAAKASEILSRQRKGGMPFLWGESFPTSGAHDGYFVEISRARMDIDHNRDNEVICRPCQNIGERIVFHFFVGSFRCTVPADSLFRIIRRFEQLAGVTSGKAKVFAPKPADHVNIVFKAVITSAIRALVPFCRKDDAFPVLTGICFDPAFGAAVGTDGHKVQVCPADMTVSKMDSLVVPAAVIRKAKKDDVLTVDDKGNVYINDEKVSSVINITPYPDWLRSFRDYASDNIANCWQFGKEWGKVKQMVKSASKAASESSHLVVVRLDGKQCKVSAQDIDFSLHREESATLNIQDNGKAAIFGAPYDSILMFKGIEKMFVGASYDQVVVSMKKGTIGLFMPLFLPGEDLASAKVKLDKQNNDMTDEELLRFYGFVPGKVQEFDTAKEEEPVTASVETLTPANVEEPVTASVKDPSMDKVIYKIFAVAACYIAVLVMVVTAFGGNDKANAINGRMPSYKAIERVITPARCKVSRTPEKAAKTRLFAVNTKTFSGSGNTIATDTVTMDTITTDTMTTDTVTTDTITTDMMTTDTVTTDTITTDTMTTAPVIPASPESSINDDSKEGSTPAALAIIPVLPIIGLRKNDRKADTNQSNIFQLDFSGLNQKYMKRVSYDFSEALNLADDLKESLRALQADPTNSQIVVALDFEDDSFTYEDVCFLIRKSEWLNGDYEETAEYSLSLCYTDIDNDYIHDSLLDFGGSYDLDNLVHIVYHIADLYKVASIYIDSL